jgi:flagellar biosynthesis component FlhA
LVGIASLLVAMAAGLLVYRSSVSGSGDVGQGTGNVRAAADLTGVKTAQTFSVMARYSGSAHMPTLSIDERMQISER